MSSTLVAPQALAFVIIGGSIAGLATALALQKAGHRCLVLEAASSPRVGYGPNRCPPNMTKILERWGIAAELQARGVQTPAIVFRDGDSSDMLGIQKLIAPVMKQFGANFLAFQHSHLYEILHRQAVEVGVHIRSGVRVVSMETSAAAPAVLLENGERITGDLIIAAGGCQKFLQAEAIGKLPRGTPSSANAYNFCIPLEHIRNDPDVSYLAETADWQIFMGNHCCLQSFAEPSTSRYLMVLKTTSLLPTSASETWQDAQPFDVRLVHTDGLGAHAQKLMGLVTEAFVTKHVSYDPFSSWVDERSRVVLVGDAAHPLAPSGSQSVAMAIEDAATLGSLFSYLNDRLKIPTLLSAYEDIRQTRCAEMQASERSKTNFISHPRGSAERVRRDAGFQDALAHDVLELEDAAEEVVASSLADYVAHWGYDAYEAVDDWWTKWGWSDPIPPAIPIPISNARARGYSVTEVNMRVEKIKAVGI